MKKILTFAVLALSSLSFGQVTQAGSGARQGVATQIRPQGPFSSADCAFTFTSGTSTKFLKFCVTATGNITVFETPEGHEHIAIGSDGEGYGICDTFTAASYSDYAEFGDSGNWRVPVVLSQSAKSVKMARTTSDGVWTLTQTFMQDAATPSVKVTMTLKNNGQFDRGAILLRYADIDADGLFDNNFDATQNSAMAWNSNNSPNPFGVELRDAGHTEFIHSGFVQDVPGGPDPCHVDLNAATGPLLGADGSIFEVYEFSMRAGQSRTVTVSYKGI